MRTSAYTTVRPRYGFADVVGLLFRETLLMIVIFLVIFAIGTAAVLTLKRSYTATSTVYAGVGQEYVYQPRLQRYAEALSNPALSPRARILAYYGELLAHFRQQERLEYHCFIGSLSFEMSELLPAIGQQVEAVLQQSALTLQHCLEQAQQAGELAADEDCANLAAFIANAWQGVLTRLKVGSQTQPVEEFVQRLERLLTA